MNPLTLAVISDLHVGEGARSHDLCPPELTKPEKKALLEEGYREKFLNYLAEHKLKADFLLLPGDVTHSAQPAEVKIASEFIASAAKALQVPSQNVVFVPGNHDVDWAVMKIPDSTGMRRAQRYDPIRQKDYHFQPIFDRGTGDLLSDSHFTIWEFGEVLVVGYNSAHHDDQNHEHYGLIDPKHILSIRAALEKIPAKDNQLRLFLVHHHPLQYSEPTPETPDRSVMVNAEQLHKLLCDFKFDILVHGHKHQPRFLTQSINGSQEIAFLSAGSFSVKLDTRWAGIIGNQFHLIEIQGRDPEDKLVHGEVRSWTYYHGRGWEPSTERYAGIPYIEPFGTYTRQVSLENIIRPVIVNRLALADYVEWTSIVAKLPRLQHLRPEIIVSALDKLSVECGYKRHGDTPDRFVLLRKAPHET